MAKLVAPLQSFSASGKVGKSIVFFTHLGRNVVRGLVTPANPQSTTQGDSRLLLGALGRAAHAVANPSDYLTQAKLAVPAGQTWVSYFIRSMIALYGSGTTGVQAIGTAYGTPTASNWAAQAATLGLTDLTISYATTSYTSISAAEMLYVLAQNAVSIHGANPTVFDVDPITTTLSSWDSADVVAFVALCNSVA